MKKLTEQDIINKSMKIYGNKLDYSMVKYIGTAHHITFICKEHGPFEQLYSNHIRYIGCKKCSANIMANRYKKTTIKFIEDAILVHGQKFDYSEVEYINCYSKILITCRLHGLFEQTPSDHLAGKGCRICARQFPVSDEEYIERFKKVHGNKYDYSKFQYVDRNTKSIFICKKHGEFQALPYNHLAGNDCYKCKSSNGEKIIKNWLLKNNIIFEQQKRFPSCKNKQPLAFDFYIQSYNMLIEYDGIGHFEPVIWGNVITEERANQLFKEVQFRDVIKDNWAKENGIYLLRIRFDDNIEETLANIFYISKVS